MIVYENEGGVPGRRRFVPETEEALQDSFRAVQRLQPHSVSLEKQLAHIASKLDSGMIPGPEDLELPNIEEEGRADSASGHLQRLPLPSPQCLIVGYVYH